MIRHLSILRESDLVKFRDLNYVWITDFLFGDTLRVGCTKIGRLQIPFHLLERNHNARFVGIMDNHLPKWRLYRAELAAAPLMYENWKY